MNIVRLSEENKNLYEALKGQYAQTSDGKVVLTLLKNILFVNVLKGNTYLNIKLPEVYDGFLQLSNGSQISVQDSRLECEFDKDETAFGQFVLKKWN